MRHALIVLAAGCTELHSPGGFDPAPDARVPPDAADPASNVHLQLGVPVDDTPADDYLLVHVEFALSYNRYLNAPNWVSYRTTGFDFGPVDRYEGDFYADDALPAQFFHTAHADMHGSGFDRGHMLRSEERTQTAERNYATFVMTNVLPQEAALNRGPWFDFELYVQRRVQGLSKPMDAYEIAGPVWPAACGRHAPRVVGDGCRDVGHGTDPARRIAVPEATFKIVVFVPRGLPLAHVRDPEVVAVLMPNIEGIIDERWYRYRSSVEEIEQRTGYTFSKTVAGGRESAGGVPAGT